MNVDLLLDTHFLIWFAGGDPQAHRLRPVFEDESSTVSISSIALSEVAIKASLGKLDADVGTIRRLASDIGLLELPWSGNHVEALARLPMHHRDPFDRMLIAQAQAEGMTIATTDRAFAAYDVPLLDG